MHKLQVEAAPQAATSLWTPANIVTLIRICLVPVFVVVLLSPWPQWFHLPDLAEHSKSLIAAAIFVLISCTDWLDGYLARSRGEVTDFGKFMDPLADKCLVTAAMLWFVEIGQMPAWALLVVIIREFGVSGLRMVAADKGRVIAAGWSGKVKTASTMVCIVLMFLPIPAELNLACVAVIVLTTIYSGVEYFVKNRDVISEIK